MEKKYPTIPKLKKLWWFRTGTILKWLILLFAIFAPTIANNKAVWYLDGIINATILYFVLLLIWVAIKYIIYGKAPTEEIFKKEQKAKKNEIIGVLIIVGIYLFLVWSFIN